MIEGGSIYDYNTWDLDESWRDDAACYGMPTDWWFPEHGWFEGQRPEAITICESCPVKAPCLQYALDTVQSHGIWGGLTTRERDRILGRRKMR